MKTKRFFRTNGNKLVSNSDQETAPVYWVAMVTMKFAGGFS